MSLVPPPALRLFAAFQRWLFPSYEELENGAADFDDYCRIKSLRYGLVTLLIGVSILVMFLPTDRWLFAADPFLVEALSVFRVSLGALTLATLIALRRQAIGRRPSMAAMLFAYCLLVAFAFVFVGRLTHGRAPFVFGASFVPMVAMVFLVPLRTRVAVTVAAGVLAIATFHLGRPAGAEFVFTSVAWVFMATALVYSVAVGDMLYRIERAAFHHRRTLEQHASRLEEVDRLKDAFLATMSHELRTPLNAIIGLTDVVLEDDLGPESRRHMRTIHDSGEALLHLINDTLDLAKIKSGKLVLQAEPVCPRELVESAADLFALACEEKGVALSCLVAPDVPNIVSDRGCLRQVLLNLLGNAVKFTEAGEICVSAELRNTSGAAVLVLSVADSGPGIPPHSRERVFDAFEQVTASGRGRAAGTGLGLSIVRRLVQEMDGEVTVEDNHPRGSVFTVTLPAIVAAVESAGSAKPDAAIPRTAQHEPPESVAGRVLLVDDVAENRQVVEAFLRGLPVQIACAETGARGLEKFIAERWDLVLMDIEMPEMDGYSAIRELRAWEAQHGRTPTPVVALTAHGSAEHEFRASSAGFTLHLAKPLRKKTFLEAIGRLLAKSTNANPPPLPPPEPDHDEEDLAPEILELRPFYLQTLAKDLELLARLTEEGAFDEIRRVGHRLEGSGGSYGFPGISRLGHALGEAAEARSVPEIARVLESLRGWLRSTAA